MLGTVVGLAISFVPGILWMVLIYRLDRFQPEPRWLVVRTFLWGIALAVPVVFAELSLNYLAGRAGAIALAGDAQLAQVAYQSFVVAGMTEELAKFMVVRLAVYRRPQFDEPMDGVVYAAAAALGFASIENVGYVARFGLQLILVRGPVSTLGHVLFSMMWGYPLALRKVRGKGHDRLVWLGLLTSMLSHGLYNFLLFTQTWASFLIIPGFIGLVLFLLAIVRHARRLSPFRARAELQVSCPECALTIPAHAGSCPVCRKPILEGHEHAVLMCGRCGSVLPPGAAYCPSCGSRLVPYPLDHVPEPPRSAPQRT